MILRVNQLVAVGPTSAELFVDGAVRRYDALAPASEYELDGVSVRTLDAIGDVVTTLATVNDVHFGETECGKVDGVTAAAFAAEPGETPYPEVMNAAVIADMAHLNPDAVIVKGDLTSLGTLEEYQRFQEFYVPAFGDKLTYVRGNHDSYPGLVFADWSVQIVDQPGIRVVLIDTSRLHESSGFVSADQVGAVVDAAHATTGPVLVMGHHPLFVPDLDNVRHFSGVRPSDSTALLDGVRRCENVVAYTAGHTHRCRRATIDNVAIVEVACVKDYPGAWAEYQIGTTGIAQIVHRASGSAAVAWAEKTRTMFDGYYGTYAMGDLTDRCFTVAPSR
jgi:3',5'-cyclic-AMP phosphodiesterase